MARTWLGRRTSRASLPTAPPGTKTVLHVGCGPPRPENLHIRYRRPEWFELRLDIDAGVRPDVVADIVDMPEVPSQSVDAVWSSHNIEHVFTHQVPLVLGEFFRVLRDGGEALITTPDLQCAAERIANGRLEDPLYDSESGPITPLDMVYGHVAYVAEGMEYMAHRTGYTARTLTQKLRAAGFAEVAVRREPGDRALWAMAQRGRSRAA